MTEKQTISFKNVATKEEAEEIIDVLRKEGVPSTFKKDSGDLDFVLQGESPTNKYEILLSEEHREKAEMIMSEKATEYLDDISPDHYLYSFTDSELIDVLIKKNEWNELDVLLSQKILKDRNVHFDPIEIERQRTIRDLELAEPEGGQAGWILVGYIAAILGGFLGLVIGYFIWHAKNKMPNGTKVFAYNESVRKHGKIIFFISVIIFPIMLILRITSDVSFFLK